MDVFSYEFRNAIAPAAVPRECYAILGGEGAEYMRLLQDERFAHGLRNDIN